MSLTDFNQTGDDRIVTNSLLIIILNRTSDALVAHVN